MADDCPEPYPEKQQPMAPPPYCQENSLKPLPTGQYATAAMYGQTRTIIIPVAASNVSQQAVGQQFTAIAKISYILSIMMLTFAAFSCIPLICNAPALILSCKALQGTGNKEKRYARISIGLNVAAITTMVIIASIVTPVSIVSTGSRASYSSYLGRYYSPTTSSYSPTTSSSYRSCPPYYSSTYGTYCTAYRYYTRSSCSYYNRYGRYCPN